MGYVDKIVKFVDTNYKSKVLECINSLDQSKSYKAFCYKNRAEFIEALKQVELSQDNLLPTVFILCGVVTTGKFKKAIGDLIIAEVSYTSTAETIPEKCDNLYVFQEDSRLKNWSVNK